MRAERMCGLARFLVSLQVSAAQTAAVQWLERTLDDSVNRRLTLPQAFLTADAVLGLALNLASTLVVNEEVIRRHVKMVSPYMATEDILMKAVALGGDRQALHEAIRKHSHEVTARLKEGAAVNNLLSRLEGDPLFEKVNFDEIDPEALLTGRAEQQVEEFLAAEVEPVRQRYPNLLGQRSEPRV